MRERARQPAPMPEICAGCQWGGVGEKEGWEGFRGKGGEGGDGGKAFTHFFVRPSRSFSSYRRGV